MSEDKTANKYKKLLTYDFLKNETFQKNVLYDNDFDVQNYTKCKKDSLDFDREIKKLCLENKKNVDLLLLMRCKVSQSIMKPVSDLYKKALSEGKYELDFKEMLKIVLEDNGERYLKLSRDDYKHNVSKSIFHRNINEIAGFFPRINNNNIRYQRSNFNYETIEKLINQVKIFQLKEKLKFDLEYNFSILLEWLIFPKFLNIVFAKNKNLKIFKENYQIISPFSAEIIYKFNENRDAGISTFTKFQVRSNKYLKSYIHTKSGLKQILLHDWSLLKDMPIETIKVACIEYGIDKTKLNYIEKVIESFKGVYPKLSKISKEKWSGWKEEKEDEILSQIFNEEKNINKLRSLLKEIAKATRSYGYKPNIDNKQSKKLSSTKQVIISDTLESIADPVLLKEIEPLDIFTSRLIKKQALKHLGERIDKDRGKNNIYWDKQPERKKAWCLFSEINLNSKYDKDEFNKILFECNKFVIKRNKNLIEDKEPELEHNLSWLSKRFDFNNVSIKTFDSVFKILKKIVTQEKFIENFNEENPENIIRQDLKEIISKTFLIDKKKDEWGDLEKIYIFSKDENLKIFRLNFISAFNPKKNRKVMLIKLVRELLVDKNIIYK